MKFYIASVYHSMKYGSYGEWYAIVAENEDEARIKLEEKEGIVHKPNPAYGGISVELTEIKDVYYITNDEQ